MSYVETLRCLDRSSPDYATLAADFTQLAKALLAVQDHNGGLWHTVLDRPESYFETSATAMIVYALIDGHRLGLVSAEEIRAAAAAWLALAMEVDENGRVVNVSGGTGPADYEQYAEKIRGTFTWGTGAFLLAASALSR
jgi:rhamnogalacturonyl hydrolase YesR